MQRRPTFRLTVRNIPVLGGRLLALLVVLLVVLAPLPVGAVEADEDPTAEASTPVYEITGDWIDPPESIRRGDPVVAEWRVNVNDSEEPPSNDPVDNVTVDFTLDKAFFDSIPDLCLTEEVEPPSSISEDGTVLTCNLGTVDMGTAVVLQTPVVANGETGEFVTHDGTIDGQTVELEPIRIQNPFIMDMQWVGSSEFHGVWDDLSNPSFVDVDVQWSLRLGQGSDVGPQEVTYTLNVGTVDGSPVDVGPHFRTDELGCTRFDVFRADGHPWSRTDISIEDERNTHFVDECTLTETGTDGVFTLTLSGINYDLLNAPTLDSFGAELPTDWNYIASGSLWFRVHTDNSGSITLNSDAPLYTAPTGQMTTDLADNNTSNKTYVLPGTFAATWERWYTGNGGTNWDDTYRLSPGTTVRQHVNNAFATHEATPDTTFGNCLTFDYAFERWDPTDPVAVQALDQNDLTWQVLDPPPGEIQYYVGDDATVTPGSGGYDPDQFDCGVDDGGWTTDPVDPSEVKAVRHLYPFSTYAAENARNLTLHAATKIDDDVEVGQDIWMFGSALGQNGWVGPEAGNQITSTPDARYPYTTGRRDILRIVTATPFLEKEAAESTVTPGVPADFTLIYSATGTGSIPPTVDGYEIVDVLPQDMMYQPGSAEPEPVVTTDDMGRQVLTWTLDDVATNVEHELTYQVVVNSSVEPGTRLTNTAQSHLENASSEPVDETVTTTSNGFTTILKTADVEFIPNEMGDGVGSGSWTIEIESFDPLSQAFTDTIDILPYNGDGRGTSFAGTYTLDDVVLPDGGTVYYTDADPATLTDDPADPDNGSAGDPTGNTVGWTTDRPANPTAIRVIGPELAPGGTFSFQVVITTDGAEPQDVYWNRAQARAEHTELVMRTSAPLIVTDYVVVKTSDPVPGSTVHPGDTIRYTITVTQQGTVPAGALLEDDTTGVLDDAVFNDDLEADLGDVELVDGVIHWSGTVPVGGVATITYSITVKDIDGLEADGADSVVDNVVWSPGCVRAEDCDPTLYVAWYEFSKTSEAAPGSVVAVGEVITYTVQVHHRGEGPLEGAWLEDDLPAVLDDATWNDDILVTSGAASRDGSTLRWDGDLEVGEVVTITYSVTVQEGGDSLLGNQVTTGDERGVCVPAADQNPDCGTDHQLGDYQVDKIADPRTGTMVEAGDIVTYTVTVTHVGVAAVDAEFEDDASGVVDDATWLGNVQASSGRVSYSQPVLRWTGTLHRSEVVTVTYSVRVDGDGDGHLINAVSTPGTCVAMPGQDQACITQHPLPAKLPITGSNLRMIALAGLALILGGRTLLGVERKRPWNLMT